jgi:Tol biopolymer transport system component
VLVQGGRIFPSEMNGFLTANVGNNSPAWSPDGKRIVFAQTYLGTTFVTGEICVVNANGSGMRKLAHTRPDQCCSQPCFSPDGKQIAFVIIQGKAGPIAPEQLISAQFTADIYTMGADGSNIKRLTNDGLSAEPAWGP